MAQSDLRKEGRRRLAIGAAGLATMLLLVALSSWLTSATRREVAITKAQAEAAGVATPGRAPSAEGGVLSDYGAAPAVTTAAPNLPAERAASANAQGGGANGATVVVPDLEPDPHLTNGGQR